MDLGEDFMKEAVLSVESISRKWAAAINTRLCITVVDMCGVMATRAFAQTFVLAARTDD